MDENRPHSDQHTQLAYVLRAYAAPGYRVGIGLNPEIRKLEAAAVAKAILRFLDARGFAVSEAQRQEILRCQDLARLDRWLRRAATASSIDEVTSES